LKETKVFTAEKSLNEHYCC